MNPAGIKPRFSPLAPSTFDIHSLPPEKRHYLPSPEPSLGDVTEILTHPMGGRRFQIPVSEPTFRGNEAEYVSECVRTGWVSSAGQYVKSFEDAFADFCQMPHGICCSSGTAALHLALAALGVKDGDEIIVPAFAMIAVANAVTYCGATPVFVDVEAATYNLDWRKVSEAVTCRTKGLIVVHTYGHPANMEQLTAIASDFGLFVLEDAAEAHGAKIGDRMVGSFGDAATFSFYGNKTLTTGEGGMVVVPNEDLGSVVRTLRDHAFSAGRHFWHRYRGYNYRMTNLQAAIGLAQTERAQALVDARRENAKLYKEHLADLAEIRLPVELPGFTSTFWMYGIEITPECQQSRDDLRSALAAVGIETRCYFVPLHWQPIFFGQFGHLQMPVAERLCASGLYLPSSSSLSHQDIAYIANSLRKILGY